MKKIKLVLSIIFIVLFFNACSPQLSDYMIIKGFGVDYNEQDELYDITVRFVDTSEMGKEKNISVKGETVYEALDELSLTSAKISLYSAADFIIYSEEVAKKGLNEALDFFVRYFKAQPKISLFVCENKAKDVLELESDGELISSDYILNLTENKQNEGKTVSSSAMIFISQMLSESESAIVPYIKINNDTLDIGSSVGIKNYKLEYSLNELETQTYLLAQGKLKNTTKVVETDLEDKITLEIVSSNSELKHEVRDGVIGFTLDVQVESVIAAMPLDSEYLSYDDLLEKLEEVLKKELEDSISKEKILQADIYKITNYLYRKEPDYYKNNRVDWIEKMDNDFIEINVKVNFIKTGEEDTGFYNEIEGL